MQIRNTFIIFLVSGFWHGANWTFIVWGGLTALFIIPSGIFKTNRNNLEIIAKGKIIPSFREAINLILSFLLVVFMWIFFTAESVGHACRFIRDIFSSHLLENPFLLYPELIEASIVLVLIVPFMLIEWAGRENNYALEKFGFSWHKSIRWSFYAFLIFCLGMFMETKESAFIYFQF